ncbi:radical SAM protein [Candidatus Omnitrophota bacterium]
MRSDLYKDCTLCPRKCHADRTNGKLGYCAASSDVVVAAYMSHKFEEPPISGSSGSGTIFFSFCTARCVYCQNLLFSRGKRGNVVSTQRLAEIMLELQEKRCHNINLVTPTHYVPSILDALDVARGNGLSLPVLYNTSGYETLETLDMLNGYIDIYMPDAKYSDDELAESHCGFINYTDANLKALDKMFKQVGNLKINDIGLAEKGLMIRHLVLPGYPDNTIGMLNNISKTVGLTVHISLMNQYSPIQQVSKDPKLRKRLSKKEYKTAKDKLFELGFENGWMQDA